MQNEATWDRSARIVGGCALLMVGAAIGGVAGVIIALVSLVPLITGLVGWCPLYALFGIRTHPAPAEATSE